MKIGYYPGCTLKTKAKALEDSALAALEALGMEVEELERWNCCGTVYSLAEDDLEAASAVATEAHAAWHLLKDPAYEYLADAAGFDAAAESHDDDGHD